MFVKHFVRMLCREELSDQDVIVYFDIVQSVVPTKLLTAYDDEKSKVGVEVMAYTSEDDEGPMWIYEIICDEEVEAEGEPFLETEPITREEHEGDGREGITSQTFQITQTVDWDESVPYNTIKRYYP